MNNILDQRIAYFQAMLQPFNIHRLTEGADTAEPWYEVNGEDAVRQLVINHLDIPNQVDMIGMQIANWGRNVAMAKRVYQLADRRYRIWRENMRLTVLQDAEKAEEKKPTEKTIEGIYRASADYCVYKRELERSEEAQTSAEAMLIGLKAKRDMLTAYAPMYRESARP